MIIDYTCQKGKLELLFTPEEDDPTTQHIFNNVFKNTMKVEMGSRRCEIHLPTDWTVRSIHPDAFALAMMAIVHPFCGPKIRLRDRKSTRLNSSHVAISYAVFCLQKKITYMMIK